MEAVGVSAHWKAGRRHRLMLIRVRRPLQATRLYT